MITLESFRQAIETETEFCIQKLTNDRVQKIVRQYIEEAIRAATWDVIRAKELETAVKTRAEKLVEKKVKELEETYETSDKIKQELERRFNDAIAWASKAYMREQAEKRARAYVDLLSGKLFNGIDGGVDVNKTGNKPGALESTE